MRTRSSSSARRPPNLRNAAYSPSAAIVLRTGAEQQEAGHPTPATRLASSGPSIHRIDRVATAPGGPGRAQPDRAGPLERRASRTTTPASTRPPPGPAACSRAAASAARAARAGGSRRRRARPWTGRGPAGTRRAPSPARPPTPAPAPPRARPPPAPPARRTRRHRPVERSLPVHPVRPQEAVDLGDVHPAQQRRVAREVRDPVGRDAPDPLVHPADLVDRGGRVVDGGERRHREERAGPGQPAPRVAAVARVRRDRRHRRRVQGLQEQGAHAADEHRGVAVHRPDRRARRVPPRSGRPVDPFAAGQPVGSGDAQEQGGAGAVTDGRERGSRPHPAAVRLGSAPARRRGWPARRRARCPGPPRDP